jgi:hypothetical protein
MDGWQRTIRDRLKNFSTPAMKEQAGVPVSIKIRVTGGCFHREHSRNAYAIIDKYLDAAKPGIFQFEEHESGPEILVYLAITSGVITLSSSIINLIATIIKARSEGQKKGDGPHEDLELIVRGFHKDDRFYEEKILRISSHNQVTPAVIKKAFGEYAKGLTGKAPAKKRLKSKKI